MAKLFKKKNHHFRLFFLGLLSMLFGFIGFLLIFNLLTVNANTPVIISQLVSFAVSVKTHLVDNYIFYSFMLLVMISILIPLYLKVKN